VLQNNPTAFMAGHSVLYDRLQNLAYQALPFAVPHTALQNAGTVRYRTRSGNRKVLAKFTVTAFRWLIAESFVGGTLLARSETSLAEDFPLRRSRDAVVPSAPPSFLP
jgi:hypothetical protein